MENKIISIKKWRHINAIFKHSNIDSIKESENKLSASFFKWNPFEMAGKLFCDDVL